MQSNLNAKSGSIWFWAVLILQTIAVIIAIIQAKYGDFIISFVPIITTLAATLAAWTQMKRHDELAKSYSLAALELGGLEIIACNLANDGDFPQLVEQVEEAISREHTMWCARRDIRLVTHN